MSGKDESIFSKSALMGTKPGKQIIKQGLFKSKGFKQFNQYKEEAENTFPEFAKRFAKNLFDQINSDESPNTCLLYTSPSPRDLSTSRMPSSA